MSFAFGRPSYGRVLRCDGVSNLGTCGRALRLHCGHGLGRPTCRRALHCVAAPNLRTCHALRWGAQLADVHCVAFRSPSCGRALRFVGVPNLGEAVLKRLPPTKICSYPSSSSSFSLVLPCVDVFVADRLFIWVPILRTLLALRLVAHLADAPFVALGRPTLVRPY
jgi:hypothetical protein